MDVTNFYIQEVRFSLSKIEKHTAYILLKALFQEPLYLLFIVIFILLQKLL